MSELDLKSPEFYFNRELSLIEFQRRVLHEATNTNHPLLERLKFTIIFSSNLDEFFMIRVAGLKSQFSAGMEETSYDGKTPGEQLKEIREKLLPMYEEQANIFNNDIMPELEKNGVFIHRFDNLTPKDKAYFKSYFERCILPVLTPLSLGPSHPFPRLIERSLNIAFVVKEKNKRNAENRVAFLQIPKVLPRFIKMERKNGHHFVLIEHVIKAFSEMLFPGLKVETVNTFRVTRDADIEIAEDEAEDLLSEIEEQIKQRRWDRAAVRLEVSGKMPDYLVELLTDYLDLEPSDVYVHNRPLNLPDYWDLVKLDLPRLKDKPFVSNILPQFRDEETNIFDIIKNEDIIVHHPFDSYSNSTLRFMTLAASDKDVLAIKITLYRTGGDSQLISALKRAVENKKQVTAFVELKARFDEENNIIWAKELEQAGVHVVYGLPGLKTHCKITMVVRREAENLKTYMHLSTGNYNQTTSRIYTDIAIFTANEDFAHDSIHLFNLLTGYSHFTNWKELHVAPIDLRQSIIKLIECEVANHTPENPGLIFAKMNSLAHREVIQALYKASQKGVKIKLLVRGICCLKPEMKGISDNIEVRSIIGRFLEHSRLFYFKNGGNEEFFISSADWMTRNLEKRVELLIPAKTVAAKEKIWELLNLYWLDNTQSWQLKSNGSYDKITPSKGENQISSQLELLGQILDSTLKF